MFLYFIISFFKNKLKEISMVKRYRVCKHIVSFKDFTLKFKYLRIENVREKRKGRNRADATLLRKNRVGGKEVEVEMPCHFTYSSFNFVKNLRIGSRCTRQQYGRTRTNGRYITVLKGF